MDRLAFALFLSCSATVAVSTSAQVVSVEKAPAVTALDGADLYRARHVLRRFFASEGRPECYDVLFSNFGGNLRVDFVPKRPDPIRYEGQPEELNIIAPCGRNNAADRRMIAGSGDATLRVVGTQNEFRAVQAQMIVRDFLAVQVELASPQNINRLLNDERRNVVGN